MRRLATLRTLNHMDERRIVYEPLTRCRAIGTVPQPAAAIYYAQRATKGGLMISEATVVTPEGHGWAAGAAVHRDTYCIGAIKICQR